MATFPNKIRRAIRSSSGQQFWIKKTLTSSGITTTAQNLTMTSTGQVMILGVVLRTDATGLAGGTNFQLTTTGVKGLGTATPFAAETVANLGANKTRTTFSQTDDATNDLFLSVSCIGEVLEAGKVIQFACTGSNCTGAGTIDVFIKCERIDEFALLSPA